jgi:hypothetical protein
MMFSQVLSIVSVTVGVALLPLSFGVIRYYRAGVNKLVNDEFSRLLKTKEISKFAKLTEQKKVTFTMVSDFYKQFLDANEPRFMLKRGWYFLLVSGVLFIISSIVGSVDFAFSDVIGGEFLLLGLALLIIAIAAIVQLENRLGR